MSTRRASARSEAIHRPVPDSLRAIGALSAAAALRARRPSQRVRLTVDVLAGVAVVTLALLGATVGPAAARTNEPRAAAMTTVEPSQGPTVAAADDPAATTSDPAAAGEDPTVPPTDPAVPTADPAAGEDPETVAPPEYPPPTVRACAPCYERRLPGPTRLGASATPAAESGGPGPVAAARPQTPSRPTAAFQLPATGSSLPTVAAVGVVLLTLGLVLRAATRDEPVL